MTACHRPTGPSVRVLLVEDDRVTCALLTEQLRRNGHLVLAVESAESALALIETLGFPDVAIVDVGLPGRDGVALLELLRERRRTHALGAVVISAGPPPGDLTPEDVFVSKPVNIGHLLSAVDGGAAA